MAYTPTVWETGDVITAQKLNKMENGIAPTIISGEEWIEGSGEFTCELCTEAEFSQAFLEGKIVFISLPALEGIFAGGSSRVCSVDVPNISVFPAFETLNDSYTIGDVVLAEGYVTVTITGAL